MGNLLSFLSSYSDRASQPSVSEKSNAQNYYEFILDVEQQAMHFELCLVYSDKVSGELKISTQTNMQTMKQYPT